MKRNVRKNFMLYLLIGVLGLGIGYAAVSNITLSINGSATAKSSVEQENLIVRFVKSTDTSSDFESVRTSAQNPTRYEASNGSTATVTSSITDDTHATFAITGLSSVGEYVDLTYYVTNLSEGIPAYISVDVENSTNDASEYFAITKTIVNDELLTQGSVTPINVRVELIARPKQDKTGNFAVKLIASSTKEESGTGGSGTPSEPVQANRITLVAAQTGETHKGIAYLDPTDLTVTCTAEDAASNVNAKGALTGVNTGCMKFYIFDDTGDNYVMILDHNTSGDVAWNGKNTNTSMKEVATRLSEDTNGWVGSPRLIDADEVAAIVKNTSWRKSNAKSTNYFYFGSKDTTEYSSQNAGQKIIQRRYAWLFDNLYQSINYGGTVEDNNQYTYGSNYGKSNITGYWTSSPVFGSSTYVWRVTRDGCLDDSSADYSGVYGVRPVITLNKSIFE